MSRLTINSNIASLNAQRNFGNATKKLSDSYTRLSSGLRINRAVDDAAGLSISESLKADTRIFNQGIRNLNDGASLLNIADGALEELSNITIRLRELATQSSNGTISNKQRLALDQEAQLLAKEYNRIARTTEFNGRKLFDGDFGELTLVAGGSRDSIIQSGLGGGIGDGTFSSYVSYSNDALGDRLAESGDLNGDGIIDIVSTNYGINTISTFIGNGDGTFKSRSVFISGSNPFDVTLNDFNGDSILDLVSADSSSNTISVLIGNGDGSFKSSNSFVSGSGAYSVDTGDFNGDGIIDILSSDFTDSTISIFIGNGNGSFKARTTLPTNIGPYSSKIADFDLDGNLDIAVTASIDASVLIYKGVGDGTFKGGISYQTGSLFNGATFVTTDDMNGDGYSDIVVANSSDKSISYLENNGDGTFKSGVRMQHGAGLNDPYSLAISDFNGDGKKDLVTIEIASNTLSIWIGNGNGTFKSQISYAAANTGAVIVDDFNNDGTQDISFGNGFLGIMLGNSNDGVSALQTFSIRTQVDARKSLTYFKNSLERISNQRGKVGAFYSRIETATNNLKQSSLGYSEANSRITDADVAEESSKLVANQIIQQAASSILAQANLQPRLVLKLLEDI